MEISNYIDISFLDQLTEGNAERKQFYISTFIDEAVPLVEQVISGSTNGQWDQVRKAAHSLKPQLHYVGANQTEKLVSVIEELANEPLHTNELFIKINQLKMETEIIISELQKELRNSLKG
ncbi:MAG: Hpt domain-containing protein [Bacteroidia bacterium]